MDKKDPVPPRRDDLEIIQTTYQGRKALVVRDSLGLIRDPVLLQGEAIELLAMLDAPRALGELRLEFVRRRGGLLEGDDGLEELVRELDSVWPASESGVSRQEETPARRLPEARRSRGQPRGRCLSGGA